MAKRYIKKKNIKDPKIYHALIRNMNSFRLGVYKKHPNEQLVDEAVGKKVYKHLNQFLRKTKSQIERL